MINQLSSDIIVFLKNKARHNVKIIKNIYYKYLKIKTLLYLINIDKVILLKSIVTQI